MARKRRRGSSEILNSTSFLDTLGNMVGALTVFLLITLVINFNKIDADLIHIVEDSQATIRRQADEIRSLGPVIDEYNEIKDEYEDQSREITKLTNQVMALRAEVDEPLEQGSLPPAPPLRIVVDEMPPAVVGVDYTFPIAVSGGVPPIGFRLESKPPRGFLLDGSNGIIKGVAPREGKLQFDVSVWDDSEFGSPIRRQFDLRVLLAANSEIPPGAPWWRELPWWLWITLAGFALYGVAKYVEKRRMRRRLIELIKMDPDILKNGLKSTITPEAIRKVTGIRD